MSKISLAFRCFFAILFGSGLTDQTIQELGLTRPLPPPPPVPVVKVSDGALQLLSILQRDGRLLDFFLEDISPYSDAQVGSAARGMHTPCREALLRYLTVSPVIDGVEGTFAKAPAKDAAQVKFIGNVPAVPPAGGVLRHRGWRVTTLNLPPLLPNQDMTVLAPAELEVE